MKQAVDGRTITVFVGPFELEVTYSASYDGGKLYGPPEDCYPPEGEISVESCVAGDEEVHSLLSESAQQKIIEECWSDFHDYVQDVANAYADYAYDAAREDRVFGR